jgi:TolB protein
MSENLEKQYEDDHFLDHVVVRHPNGQSDKVAIPADEGAVLRIGRELDNEVVLIDPRASRYHAEMRRSASGIEIKDLHSANGTLIGTTRIEPETWTELTAGQMVQLAETRLFWEKAASAQSTVAMSPAQKQAAAATSAAPDAVAVPAPVAASAAAPQRPAIAPWMIGVAVAVLLLIAIGVFLAVFGLGGQQGTGGPAVVEGQPVTSPTAAGSLAQQTPSGGPVNTPTPSGPQLAIPVVEIVSAQVQPILLGALPSTDKALLLVKVRVQNVGNAPFKISTDNFLVRTRDGKTILREAGGTTSPEGLKRLGAIDRFNDLNLTPGGSVPESLIFEVKPQTYDVELVFEPDDLNPIVLGLGTIRAGEELALALGTPVVEGTEAAVASANTATPTPEPTPTATRPPVIPAPQVVPKSALVGTIAYAVFNGNDYDLYLGQADGSGTKFFRAGASQPAFSPDGSRIVFHSWKGDSRGLVAMDVSGANGKLISNFIEDQLPTWMADGENVMFLSRRTGGRQSQLYKANGSTELSEAVLIGEGEYPSINPQGKLVFKGWGTTAYGLRMATSNLEDLQSITNVDEDTAPALSPDGRQVAFMSRREGNWEIYIINADGSDLQRLTNDPADDGLPTWSPDGNAIAFVSNRGGPWAVWAMTPDGSGQRQLFTMEGSPDGQVGTDTFASRGWAEERISWTK